MDRKGIIAIVAAIAVLLGWTQYYSRQMAKYQEERRVFDAANKPKATPAPETAGVTPSTTAAPGAPGTAAPAAPGEPAVAERTEQITTPAVDYTFTNLGGGIARAALLQHKTGKNVPVQLNPLNPIPIGAITEGGAEGGTAPFNITPGDKEITFERTDARGLQITKKFTLPRAGAPQDEYVALLDVTFTNKNAASLGLPSYYVHAGLAIPLHQDDLPTYTGMGYLRAGKFVFKDSGSFSAGGFLGMGTSDAPVFTETVETPWAGVTNQYYSSIVTPKGAKTSSAWGTSLPGEAGADSAAGLAGRIPRLRRPPRPRAKRSTGCRRRSGCRASRWRPARARTQRFQLYTGPREYERLKRLGAREEEIMYFGMFGIVSKTLLKAMNTLRAWLGTYALAIIVLTIIIRGLMWPLQNKATQSMKSMRRCSRK